MMSTNLRQKFCENKDKDFQIAKLKAQAFDLSQKQHDYDTLHLQYTQTSQKHFCINEQGSNLQNDLKASLSQAKTKLHGLSREVDQKLAIQIEDTLRCQKLKNIIEQTLSQNQTNFQHYECARNEMNNFNDQVLLLERQQKLKQVEIQSVEAETAQRFLQIQKTKSEIESINIESEQNKVQQENTKLVNEDIQSQINQAQQAVYDLNFEAKNIVKLTEERRKIEQQLIQDQASADKQQLIQLSILESEKQFFNRIHEQLELVQLSNEQQLARVKALEKQQAEYQASIQSLGHYVNEQFTTSDQLRIQQSDLAQEIVTLANRCDLITRLNEEFNAELHIQMHNDVMIQEKMSQQHKDVQSLKKQHVEMVNQSLQNLNRSRSPIRNIITVTPNPIFNL